MGCVCLCECEQNATLSNYVHLQISQPINLKHNGYIKKFAIEMKDILRNTYKTITGRSAQAYWITLGQLKQFQAQKWLI